ncbi:MAG TPA: hypothetical protein VIM57_03585 [Luteolibacter sp.]
MLSKKTFSISWFLLVSFLHIAGTVALSMFSFMDGMGSFTKGSDNGIAILLCAWTPLAMYLSKASVFSNAFIFGSLLWSTLVGIFAGHLGGFARNSPVLSPSDPDTAGTPWERDPDHTFDKKS